LGRGAADRMHWGQEAISLPRDSFNEAWIFRVVLKGGAQFLECGVQTAIKINVCTLRPERLAKLFAGDNLAGPLQEHGKNAKGLFLDPDADALAGDYTLEKVDLVEAKPKSNIGADAALCQGISPLKPVRRL